MTIRLSLRKRFRKLMANSKGFSSVIGTTFMVLVMMFLGTSVFLWTLSQNTLYNEAVKEKNQLEMDRLNERVKAFDAVYTVTDNDVSVSVELQNQGPLSVLITNLWVMDVNIGIYNFSKSLSINYLQPGENAILTANVTIMGSASGHRFSSWLITGRGNVVPLEEKEVTEEIITSANVTQGIGSLAMDFPSFKYYKVTGNQLGQPQSGFNISAKDPTVFRLILTNFDESHRNITLTAQSLLWLYSPAKKAQVSWMITKVVNQTLVPFDFQVLEFAESTEVFFGESTATQIGGSLCAANLLLYGKIGTDDYGQNIPFVSVYVQP